MEWQKAKKIAKLGQKINFKKFFKIASNQLTKNAGGGKIGYPYRNIVKIYPHEAKFPQGMKFLKRRKRQ